MNVDIKHIISFILFLILDFEYSLGQIYNLNAALNGQTIAVCRGLFRDSGGGDIANCLAVPTVFDYSANENRAVTFCSTNGKPIRVSFLWWDLETGFDGIFVYDGPSTASPQLIAFTGSGQNYAVPNFYTSTGTCLTFRFLSDNVINWCGWEALIGCEPESCGTSNNLPASDICSTSPLICDFDGYCGNTGGWYTPDNATLGTTGTGLFCGSIENNSWLSFIADAPSASFRITSSNCVFPVAAGIQAQIFSSVNCTQFAPVSGCVSQAGGPGAFNIATTTALVPGQRYYIMIDGFAGNICDYTITPLTGVSTYDITGPSNNTICANQSTVLSVTGAPPGSTFQWSPSSAISGASNGISITASPGVNTTNYSVLVTSPSGCGNQTLNYTLNVSDLSLNLSGNTNICAGENTVLTALATAEPSVISFSNNSATVITDNSAIGISSNIVVTGIPITSGAVLENICLDISHAFVGDLEIILRCPDGATINLSMRRGGGGDNYTGTCFGLSGPGIAGGVAPFTGIFTPEQAISLLAGCSSNGTWTLIVRDRVAGDVGTLLGWSLTFKNLVSYSWTPAIALSSTSGSSVVATPGNSISYTVTVQDLLGCSNQAIINLNVNQPQIPIFNPLPPFCEGATSPTLPLISNNAISGTWLPAAVNNNVSSTYTFNPDPGQCAVSTTLNSTVISLPVSTSIYHD